MDASILIQGLGLAAVVVAMIWDTRANEDQARQGVARAEAAGDPQRCPFCHEGYEGLAGTVRCRACGTRHHCECWKSHGGCTVLGCDSEFVRMPEEPAVPHEEVSAPPEAPAEEAPVPEALTEATPCG